MTDKYSGSLAGGGALEAWGSTDSQDALRQATLHEVLLAADEEGNLVPFRIVLNPADGSLSLAGCPENDASNMYQRAIAFSQMRSMLNDSARCTKYADAIRKAVVQAKASKIESARDADREGLIRVLDIGSGTGLLAMLAARAGAETVHACEMFAPLACLAQEIIQQNQLGSHVSVFPFASTTMSVQEPSERYDVLVTEIFDSTFLGEGALPVLAHAREHVLKPDAIVVPAKATIYGQLVESSDLFASWHDLTADGSFDFPFWRSTAASHCDGGSRLVPVHLDALQRDYSCISEPFELFTYNFNNSVQWADDDEAKRLHIPIIRNGAAHAVLAWWEMDLCGDGETVYSTAVGKENWQDHWLQCCFPLPRQSSEYGASSGSSTFSIGQEIELVVGRTGMQLWFSLDSKSRSQRLCSCGFHALRGGPQRISMLSNEKYISSLRESILKSLSEIVKARRSRDDRRRIIVLDISSDSSICGLLALDVGRTLNFGRISVISVEPDIDEYDLGAVLYRQIASFWSETSKVQVDNKQAIDNETGAEVQLSFDILHSWSELERFVDALGSKVDLIVAEPWMPATASYPVETASSLWLRRAAVEQHLSADALCTPTRCIVYAQLVEFESNTLSRSFQRCGKVLNLDHTILDEVCEDKFRNSVERFSLPLYMYKHRTVSDPVAVFEFEMRHVPPETATCLSKLEKTTHGRVDALILWTQYDDRARQHTDFVEFIPLFEHNNPIDAASALQVKCTWNRSQRCGMTVEGLAKIAV